MRTIHDVKLGELLPNNLTSDSSMRACSEATDPQLKEISAAIGVVSIYANIDSMSSEQLDHFAAGRNMTTWRDSWPIDVKRSIAKSMIAQKARMGTLSAVKTVLASLGSAVSIVEWWQEVPRGQPHTFKITATLGDVDGVLTEQMQEDFFLLLNGSKPVRSHFTFTLSQNIKGQMQVLGCHRSGGYFRAESKRKPFRLGVQLEPVLRPVTTKSFSCGRKAIFCKVQLNSVLRPVTVVTIS